MSFYRAALPLEKASSFRIIFLPAAARAARGCVVCFIGLFGMTMLFWPGGLLSRAAGCFDAIIGRDSGLCLRNGIFG